jgi:hypothetical protein
MKQKSFLAQLVSWIFWVAAIGWIAVEFQSGYRIERAQLPLLVIAAALVILGDIFEIDLRGGRSTPASNAVVFALFVVLEPPEMLLVILPSFFIAMVVRSRQFGWGPRFRSTSRRLATTMFARAFYIALSGILPAFPQEGARGELLSDTVAMVLAGLVFLVLDTFLSASLISIDQRIPVLPIWRSQLQNLSSIHVAFLSVSALIALAFGVLQEWAFVLFLLPLLAARHAFRRYSSIHKTYEQTIRALSRSPELAGYAQDGHSTRVAELAVAMARQQGLSDNEAQEVEFAALLHDIGRFSFDDPADVPESMSGTPAGQRLAEASSSVVGQTKYLSRVANLVREQDASFDSIRKPAIGARIVKVANDYVELVEEGPGFSPLTALHQLELQAGADYDPALVKSLRSALEMREII